MCICWCVTEINYRMNGATIKTVRVFVSCIHYRVKKKDLDSSVGIATGYGLDGPGIESRWGVRFSANVQPGPGAHPASHTMGTGSFPGVKRMERRVEHPPSYSSEVKERVEL